MFACRRRRGSQGSPSLPRRIGHRPARPRNAPSRKFRSSRRRPAVIDGAIECAETLAHVGGVDERNSLVLDPRVGLDTAILLAYAEAQLGVEAVSSQQPLK